MVDYLIFFLYRVYYKLNKICYDVSAEGRRKYYRRLVYVNAKSVGPGLYVNTMSRVNDKTVLGTNVNFNGMTVIGSGTVQIGDNFHSGINCIIMTGYHNYDKGEAILDYSIYIHKDVCIDNIIGINNDVTNLDKVNI